MEATSPPKRWYLIPILNGVINQNISTWIQYFVFILQYLFGKSTTYINARLLLWILIIFALIDFHILYIGAGHALYYVLHSTLRKLDLV